jgi:hypothetical protein
VVNTSHLGLLNVNRLRLVSVPLLRVNQGNAPMQSATSSRTGISV